MKPQRRPDILALSTIEEQLLLSRLDALRQTITHAGEKGRSLEGQTISLLRTFLPAEYGLSTGFVMFHGSDGPQLSSQLDIIIYDALRTGPIVRLTTCDVFPLEAVYGYIEVKASLQSTSDDAAAWPDNSLEKCIDNNRILRSMTDRRFWTPRAGTSTGAEIIRTTDWPALRSYIFTFSADGATARNPKRFAQRLANYSARLGHPVHLHGVLIPGNAFYFTRPIDMLTAKAEHAHHVQYTTDHPLAAFKWRLLHELARFPRFGKNWTPAIDQYVIKTSWDTCAPQVDQIISKQKKHILSKTATRSTRSLGPKQAQ
jgi:hypothetical protein